MICHACGGRFDVDEQNTHAVCPWCGALTQAGARLIESSAAAPEAAEGSTP